MYPMILGLEKIEVSALLRTNGVFQYITGLPSFPNPSTFRRFLLRAATDVLPQLRQAHDQLRSHFLRLPETPSSFSLDCDSTARLLYGSQEGASKSYHPTHHRAKTYHPLLITEGHRGDCLGGILRPGNVFTSVGIEELFDRVFALLPHHQRIRLRADAGFYSGDFLHHIRDHVQFAVVAKMTPIFKSRMGGLRYRRINGTSSTASFSYCGKKWDHRERFVVHRRDLPPEDTGQQQTLFTLDRYAYSVLVTNLPLTPYGCFTFYEDRGAMERIVRTLKEDYPFGTAPTGSFAANALYTELSILAYNLIIWFKRLCLPEEWQSFTLPTIRHRLLMTPGEFVRTGNVPTLRFPHNNPYREVFESAQKQIEKLSPLI
jgi:hypothetical protein